MNSKQKPSLAKERLGGKAALHNIVLFCGNTAFALRCDERLETSWTQISINFRVMQLPSFLLRSCTKLCNDTEM